jgi:protein ImuB
MQGQRRVIASVDAAATALDLGCGMTVTHAQSLIPDLTVVEATPEDDGAALMRLALWCIKYSPLVTPDPPDGVLIDVAGSAHLFQGEAALINDLCRRLKAEGITAKALWPTRPAPPARSRAMAKRKSFRRAVPRRRLLVCRSRA